MEPYCQILINYHYDEKTKTAIPKYSQKHLIKNEIIDFNNDTIKIDSMDSSKSLLKIFFILDGKKVENNKKDEPNFYKIKLKEYETNNKFYDLNFNLVNNIEINLSLKLKDIISRGIIASRMNMFNKRTQTLNISESPISTGISVKDRLKLFNSSVINYTPPNKNENKTVIKKIKTTNNSKDLNELDNKGKSEEIKKNERSINEEDINKKEKEIKDKNINKTKPNKEVKKEKKEELKIEKKKIKEEIKKIENKDKDNMEVNNENKNQEIKNIEKKEKEKLNNKINKEENPNKKEEEISKEKEPENKEISNEKIQDNEKKDILNIKKEEIEENKNNNKYVNNKKENDKEPIKEETEVNLEQKDFLEENKEIFDENKETTENENKEEQNLENNENKEETKQKEEKEGVENSKNEENEEEKEKVEKCIENVEEKEEVVTNIENAEEKEGVEDNKTEESAQLKEKIDANKYDEKVEEKEDVDSNKNEENIEEKKIEEKLENNNFEENKEVEKMEDKQNESVNDDIKPKIKEIKEDNALKEKEIEKKSEDEMNNGNIKQEKKNNNEDKAKKEKTKKKEKKIIPRRKLNYFKEIDIDNFFKDEWEYNDNSVDKSDITFPEESEEEEIEYEEIKNDINSDTLQANKILSSKTIEEKKEKKSENNKLLRAKTSKEDDFSKIKLTSDLGFEILDSIDEEIQPSSTMSTSMESSLPENILESINYQTYLSEIKSGKKEISHETFCEGFFIASFPKNNGEVMEKSASFPSCCGHKECSKLPSMKPEIILKYPLKNTKNLEFNNLAATICFPTGIKLCYSETENPKPIEDYVTQITNQKGERLYMRTFHFYKKMSNFDFPKEYEVTPLKYNLKTFADEHLLLKEEEFTEEITTRIQKKLDFSQQLGSSDIVYIPHCLCLISKYPYISELGKCLETIFRILGTKKELLNFEINDLIMYLINSIPIPEQNMKIQFYIPCCNSPKIELQCPKINDIAIMNSDFMGLFKYLSVDNIVLIFRLLLSEKKILFIHDDYTELTNITNSFITLLYPFQWIHPYIPIMSTQMLKYLETFLPFINGIHVSLMNWVEKIFQDGESLEDEVFLVYIKTDEINISSSFKKNKNKFWKYVQNNIPPLPYEKDLKKDLKILETSKKQAKNEFLENKFREAFINVFVKMFQDYEKYIMNLDEDTVFNKELFMKNMHNKEDKDDQFYNEFLDSQLFQQFSQNSQSQELRYFRKKIKEYKDKENNKVRKDKNMANAINKKDVLYLAPPYIGLKSMEKNNIDIIIESYKVNDNDKDMKNKILEDMLDIEEKKYINKKCLIYLNPEKKESSSSSSTKGAEKKNKNVKFKKGDLTEKQLESIKDNIKEIVVKIFKTQIVEEEKKSMKKKVFRDLETSAGRSFFISLISNNNKNIISLQESNFLFLEELIQGILNSTLKSDETDQLIEEIVILIKSTKYFQIDMEEKEKNAIKVQLTMFQCLKKFLNSYNKITQKNLWKKWYDIDVKKKIGENSDENKIKEKIILRICKNMLFLEISKSNIKNNVENINKIAFGEGTELFENVKKEYINLIIKANYISGLNKV